MNMRAILAILTILIFFLVGHAKSYGCPSGKINILLVVDEEKKETDTTPPDKVSIESVEIIRGEDVSGTLCVSVGMIGFKIGSAKDNMTQPDSMGFQVELVSGADPGRVSTYNEEGTLWVNFGDNRTKPIDFTFRIASVDQAGNAGEWSSPIKVTHPGINDGGGCASVALGGHSAILLLLLLGITACWVRKYQ